MVYGLAATFILLLLTGDPEERLNRRSFFAILSMGAIVIGYLTLYTFDCAAIQPWYFANYLLPYSILVASIFAIAGRTWRILPAFLLILWACRALGNSCMPIWPQQIGFYRAGIYLQHHPELMPVGSWNAGIVSFVAPTGVVNLDGLVNDDAVPYVLSNSIDKYLVERHLYRIVDDAWMWDTVTGHIAGGFSGNALVNCIDSRLTLWQAPREQRGTGDHVQLSTLNPKCVSGIQYNSPPSEHYF